MRIDVTVASGSFLKTSGKSGMRLLLPCQDICGALHDTPIPDTGCFCAASMERSELQVRPGCFHHKNHDSQESKEGELFAELMSETIARKNTRVLQKLLQG